jgi:hypothetical protein
MTPAGFKLMLTGDISDARQHYDKRWRSLRSCRYVSKRRFVSARATDLLPFIARSFGVVTGAPAASAKVEDGIGVNDGEGTMSNVLAPDDSTGAKVLKVGAVMWV